MEVAGVEPASKTRRVAVHPQACSALETPRRGTDEPLGACAFQSRCRLEGEGGIHPVPPFGRPKPPVGGFNESATRRSRFLARRLSCLKRREPIRSCRWQFVLGGLMRGPAVQPPPAPSTWIMTCRNRSPPKCGRGFHEESPSFQKGQTPPPAGPVGDRVWALKDPCSSGG